MTCGCGGTNGPFDMNGSGSCICSCCEGTAPETPETITNRPALGQIGYRTGRYATFNASMLAALSDQPGAPLAGLRTRDPADFSIALIDSWAVVLDILTFYSERLANEAFLRTAVEQRSVTELAALVGYVPSPGVSASATLAFTLSSAPGSPAAVLIPAGTRVQSVPGPGQTAQVFETSADLNALASWNALPAQTTVPWSLLGSERSTWVTGTANNLSVGDALLFVSAPGGTPSATGPSEVHFVTAVSTDPVAKATQITWEAALATPAFKDGAALYAFGKKAALYGATAPNPQTLAGANIASVPGWPGSPPPAHWNYLPLDPNSMVSLDASYSGLAPVGDGSASWLLMIIPAGTNPLMAIFTIGAAQDAAPGYYTLTSRVSTLTVADPQVLYEQKPWWWDAAPPTVDTVLSLYIGHTPDVTAYVQSVRLTGAPLPRADWATFNASHARRRPLRPIARVQPAPDVAAAPTGTADTIAALLGYYVPWTSAAGMLAPVAGSAVTVTGGQQIGAGQPAGMSGKRLRLQVPPAAHALFVPGGASGGSAAADGQTFLVDAFPPAVSASGDAAWSVITVSGVAGTLSIPAGPVPAFLPAAAADPVTGEAVVVQAAVPSGDVTRLTLAGPLARIYDTSSVTVNANAVAATNGETVQEILGSGDATNAALTFTLKQAPLTYLTAPVAAGSQSTLQLWVNNLRWQEAPDLLAAEPADRVFTTSVNASGNTVVRFGDGTRGGRTPTGQANIRAVYRKGTGLAGMVSAGQLSQALDRPQGLSSVINPSAAGGGADPATAAEIRASAPLPTLTISRVVSLEDYQDYALGFAGIAKALATWTWTGDLRGVFLTVAGANGATLGPADPIVTSLVTSLRRYGDPHVPLTVASYVPARFTFTAAVAVDTASYAAPAVLGQVWQSVCAAFAFGRRPLGQGVAASEITEIIQGVPGVTALRLTGFGRSGTDGSAGAPAGPVLCASGPQPPAGAELLVLDPAAQGQIGGW
jgi:hypothetical protein